MRMQEFLLIIKVMILFRNQYLFVFIVDMFVGAAIGPEIEDRWASNNMIRTRWPFQFSKIINKCINKFDFNVMDNVFVIVG